MAKKLVRKYNRKQSVSNKIMERGVDKDGNRIKVVRLRIYN